MAERPQLVAYLLPAEAAELLGCSLNTIDRRVLYHELPALILSDRTRRIEAGPFVQLGLLEACLDVLPEGPDEVDVGWLARLWRVRPKQLRQLAQAGGLPFRKRHGRWLMSRRAFCRFVLDHTTGDEG